MKLMKYALAALAISATIQTAQADGGCGRCTTTQPIAYPDGTVRCGGCGDVIPQVRHRGKVDSTVYTPRPPVRTREEG